MRRLLVGWGLVLGVAVATSWAVTAVPAAAAGPKVCSEAKITPAIVKKVFGAKATIAGAGASQTGRCALESGVHGKAPTGCDLPSSTCLNTDVRLTPASAFATTVSGVLTDLGLYGHARKTPFTGAGAGAVLLTASSYGGSATNPLVIFKAGAYTVVIEGPFGGVSEPNSVYKKWEALAREIYARLG